MPKFHRFYGNLLVTAASAMICNTGQWPISDLHNQQCAQVWRVMAMRMLVSSAISQITIKI